MFPKACTHDTWHVPQSILDMFPKAYTQSPQYMLLIGHSQGISNVPQHIWCAPTYPVSSSPLSKFTYTLGNMIYTLGDTDIRWVTYGLDNICMLWGTLLHILWGTQCRWWGYALGKVLYVLGHIFCWNSYTLGNKIYTVGVWIGEYCICVGTHFFLNFIYVG